MLSKLFIAWFLMSLCVTIHAIGLTAAFRWMKRRPTTIALAAVLCARGVRCRKGPAQSTHAALSLQSDRSRQSKLEQGSCRCLN